MGVRSWKYGRDEILLEGKREVDELMSGYEESRQVETGEEKRCVLYDMGGGETVVMYDQGQEVEF